MAALLTTRAKVDCSRGWQGPPRTFWTRSRPSSGAQGRSGTYAPEQSWAQGSWSWDPGRVANSGSFWSSRVFVQRGRGLPQDPAPSPDPTHLISHSWGGEVASSCQHPWNDLAVPSYVTAVTGPRPPGTESISVPERSGLCPHKRFGLLPMGP